MTGFRDPDDHTIERLLRGDLPSDDAPPELVEVARLVGAARAAPTGDELAGSDRAASAITARPAVDEVRVAAERPGAKRVDVGRVGQRSRRFAVGATVATVFAMGTIGVAAAITQSVRSHEPRVAIVAAVTTVVPAPTGDSSATAAPEDEADGGVEIPSATRPGDPDVPTEPAARPVGPDPMGAARQGLCTAFGARTEPPGDSVAAANLATSAAAAGQSVEEFCAAVEGAASVDAPPPADGSTGSLPPSRSAVGAGPPAAQPGGPPTTVPGQGTPPADPGRPATIPSTVPPQSEHPVTPVTPSVPAHPPAAQPGGTATTVPGQGTPPADPGRPATIPSTVPPQSEHPVTPVTPSVPAHPPGPGSNP